jgi:hypothetical protein
MPKAKKQAPIKRPTYLYVVQDYEQNVCGVYSTLQLAAEVYDKVLTEGLLSDDIKQLIEEYGENFHDEMDYPACIVVHELDLGQVWSYDTMEELRATLANGEDFDNYT